jgi:dihydrodipicolinate synthase/N-acetylneuraminate lyase
MKRFRPDGIHAVLYAFFDADEQLDRALMRAEVEAVIGAGVAGVTVLGLATEVGKLSSAERKQLMQWTAQDVAGRVTLSITINGHSVAEQIDQLKAAEAAGADWLILQPPTIGTYPAAEYIRFFGRVADAASVPVAIQNAPAYFGRGLSGDEIRTLFLAHPALQIIKGEGPAIEIEALIRTLGPEIPVLNGRGGLEFVDSLRAGCSGLILAPDLVDKAVAIQLAFASGDQARADQLYAEELPAIIFLMQSLEGLMIYGKRLFAARAGLGPVHDRAPSAQPTPFGLAITARLAQALGPFAARSG